MRNMEGKREILKFFLAIFLTFVLQYKKGKERQGEPMTEDKGVQSIDRALDIIEAVAEAGRPMGLTEIANQVGLHKSTAYRIIETLF